MNNIVYIFLFLLFLKYFGIYLLVREMLDYSWVLLNDWLKYWDKSYLEKKFKGVKGKES